MASTLLETVALYQAQITLATTVIGLVGTLFSQKMRDIYTWPFRMFHKAFGNKAMEDKLDYLIQELTYDQDGTTLKKAIGNVTDQLEAFRSTFQDRALQLSALATAVESINGEIARMHQSITDKNTAMMSKFMAMLDQPNTPPMFETNAEGECIWVSASYIAMTQRGLSELTGWGWTNAIHPEDIEEVRHAWELCVEDRRVFEHTYRFMDRDKKVFKVNCRATPICHDGTITGWIGVIEILNQKKKHSSNAEMLFIS